MERIAAIAAAHTPRRSIASATIGAFAMSARSAPSPRWISSTDDAGYLAAYRAPALQGFPGARLLIRPLGNTIYLMPPYCSTPHELECVFNAISEVVDGIG